MKFWEYSSLSFCHRSDTYLIFVLQVVKKSAAPQEPTTAMVWPRGVGGTSFPAARFSRAPFPRGSPGAFWPRPPMRIGARSMQWKRGSQGAAQPDNARGLTYIRTESKPESS